MSAVRELSIIQSRALTPAYMPQLAVGDDRRQGFVGYRAAACRRRAAAFSLAIEIQGLEGCRIDRRCPAASTPAKPNRGLSARGNVRWHLSLQRARLRRSRNRMQCGGCGGFLERAGWSDGLCTREMRRCENRDKSSEASDCAAHPTSPWRAGPMEKTYGSSCARHTKRFTVPLYRGILG
jgi:hypothetical protein